MSLIKKLGSLPHEVKRPLKFLRYAPGYYLSRYALRRDPLPPRWLRFESASDFSVMGNHLLALCQQPGGLHPSDDVLDLGCGIGRLALPLGGYLDENGSYTGLDVDKKAIRWCQDNIASRDRRFRFDHAEVANSHYYRGGANAAASFTFPYADASFDFAVATSLFTHLLPEECERYLQELSRVLRPGARVLITWFLFDDPAHAEGPGQLKRFPVQWDAHSRVESASNPCAAIAFDTSHIRRLHADNGLLFDGDVYPGSWRGPEVTAPLSMQDVVIATKQTAVG